MVRILGLLCLLVASGAYASTCKVHEKTYEKCMVSNKDTKKCEKDKTSYLECKSTDICRSIATTNCSRAEKKYKSCLDKNRSKNNDTKKCDIEKDVFVMCYEKKELFDICKKWKNKKLFSKYRKHTHGVQKSKTTKKLTDKEWLAKLKDEEKVREVARSKELVKLLAEIKAKKLAHKQKLDKIKKEENAIETARIQELTKIRERAKAKKLAKKEKQKENKAKKLAKKEKRDKKREELKAKKEKRDKKREELKAKKEKQGKAKKVYNDKKQERKEKLDKIRKEAREKQQANDKSQDKIRQQTKRDKEEATDNDKNIVQEVYAAVGVSYFDFKRMGGFNISSDPINYGLSVGINLSLKNILKKVNIYTPSNGYITPHIARYSGAAHKLEGRKWLKDTTVTVIGVSYESRNYIIPSKLYIAPFLGIQHKSITASAVEPFVNNYRQSGIVIPAGLNTAWHIDNRWSLFGQLSIDVAYLFGEKKYNDLDACSETTTGPGMLVGAVYKF